MDHSAHGSDDFTAIRVNTTGSQSHQSGTASAVRSAAKMRDKCKVSASPRPSRDRSRRRSSFMGYPQIARRFSTQSIHSVMSSASGKWGGAALSADLQDHRTPVHVPDDTLLEVVPPEELKAPVIQLESLPVEFREVMRRYDLDGNGVLDREESIHAAADLARMRHQIEQGIVHLHAFPASAQPMLQRHDLDGDGTLDVSEMIIAFEALERERKRSRMWMRVAIAALLFIAVLLLSMSGLIYLVLDFSRDSSIQGSVLVVKDSSVPVQTASMELTVKGGVLLERNSRCAGDAECPIQVAEASAKQAVSSLLPDEDLKELKQLRISSEVAWVQLRVFGVQRVPDPSSSHGSIVIVYTHQGELVLDGNSLVVGSVIRSVLARSGLISPYADAERTEDERLDGLDVEGTFNSVVGSSAGS